jgi:RNA-directed DNA polymerase
LDTSTMLDPTEVADIAAVVNGPEDEPLDWDATQWRHAEENVRRLRQRIFAASRAGDLKRVRNLQKLMVRHEARVSRMGVKDRHRLIVVAVG